jgi:hypothetical protein
MSVALWIVDASRGEQRAEQIARFAGGAFGFESMPLETTTREQATAVRTHGLRVNGHSSATGDPNADAERVHSALQRLAPVGLVDIGCELPDEQLAAYMRAFVAAFRAFEPTHPLRLNITPNKHGFLPADLYANDANLYAAMQTYYGNMQGRYSEASALAQLLSVGVPLGRAQVVYAAMCDTWDPRAQLWRRTLTLPSLFIGVDETRTTSFVTQLGGGPVFSDDLLADSGLLV